LRGLVEGGREFLIAAQRPEGAWGYRPGGMAFVEPTAWALLALRGGPDVAAAVRRGQDWLAGQQRPDGAFGAFPADSLPSWMSGLAALALRGRPEGEHALDWLIRLQRSIPLFTGDPEPLRRTAGIDGRKRGWPWAPGDATWTEPTAIAVLALAAGGRRDAPEVRDGIEFLFDRAGPDGGWNLGNPFMLGKPMRSEVPFTGQALLALRAAGVEAGQPRVSAALAFLRERLPGLVSPHSLAWARLALPLWDGPRPDAPALAPLQRADGSFEGNILMTALALVAEAGATPILGIAP
jgi:hypothetical protein